MASSFQTAVQNTTVNFSWTATTTMIQNIVGGAAEYLWNHGSGHHGTQESPILFSDLTNTQKLTIVENYLKQVILDLANTKKSVAAQEAARLAEELNKYTI